LKVHLSRMLKIDQNYRITAPKFPYSALDHTRINEGNQGVCVCSSISTVPNEIT